MTAPPFPLALLAGPHRTGTELKHLADTLGIPLIEEPEGAVLLLRFMPEGLELAKPGDPLLPGSLRAEFTARDFRRRLLHPGRELLVQAARVRGGGQPLVVDATAGLGRDGFLLAAAGYRVRMIEANPVVAALLADGLARARCIAGLAAIAARIDLIVGDAREQLPALVELPEVVYLDPMFPERTKSALVRQELRLLQLLDQKNCDDADLLRVALAVAAKKVVVKRPLKAPPLAAVPPGSTRRGKAVRFDVYAGKGKKEVSG
ncbi:class I SAM-dependent methyltransferase [Desulfobulbus elongatus]|uniref:class I SAM-dependent methyltransferase n=1 Tax=Desulfobulbus elongatus TaxID=53332 RepID=UPI0006853701|nr:class I SAM-dependent methyltransferase [Desulfobulbus elongatus]